MRAWPGVIDVVVTADCVAAYFDRTPAIADGAIEALAILTEPEGDVREHVIRARYDGEDLAEVARTVGLSVEEVIARHAAATYTVELMGFAPGFAYLVGLDPVLRIPRRATPRTRVPAGSLAIAEQYTGVYPFESAGGWHLIGRVATPMYGDDGALLALGDRVRFVP